MKDKNEKAISSLFIDNEAMGILKNIERLASSENKNLRRCIPSLLIVASNGSGISSYGQVYNQILEASPVLRVQGSSTFLELVFPKNDAMAEKLFFSSPQRAASVRNRFYGTMLISLREYEGVDLLKSDAFQHLLDFIESNKRNIHFVFHICPEFYMKKELMKRLSGHINLLEVVLEKPNLEIAYKYMEKELCNFEYIVDENIQKKIKNDILKYIVEREDFTGYKALQNLVEKIQFELALAGDGIIKEEIVERLVVKMKEETESFIENGRIGFHI